MLYNAYSKEIIKRVLEKETLLMKINRTSINTIGYMDDTIIVADHNEDLQRLMDSVVKYSAKCWEKLNVKQTKFMKILTQRQDNQKLMVHGKRIVRGEKYTYLFVITAMIKKA